MLHADRLRRLCACALSVGMLFANTSFASAEDDQETQIGKQVYDDLKKKNEILTSSPYYAVLNPIAKRISTVASPLYEHPFHFILVHQKSPNAFAAPGGNVYVTDSLMTFVQNREELAGVLCHETSHDIHHDVVTNMAKDQRLGLAAGALQLLLGKAGGIAQTAIGYAANIQSLTYSRKVETAADLTGSEICATAGYNPNGMIWLFRQFEKADTGGGMEMLSDHPNNAHRINDLQNHFRDKPEMFSKYSTNIATATPLSKVAKHPVSATTPRPAAATATRSTQSRSRLDPIEDVPPPPPPVAPARRVTPAPAANTSHANGMGSYGPQGNDVPRFP